MFAASLAALAFWSWGQQTRADSQADYSAALERFGLAAILLAMVMAGLFAGLTLAIRRRLEAEEAWRGSEERFHLLADNAREYGIIMLDPDGNVSTWNPGAQRIKGYSPGEIIGQHFSRFYRAEDIANGKPATGLQAAARDGQVRDQGWRVRKDGSAFWADVVITALYDPSGIVRGYGKLTRDATQQKQLEDDLREQAASRAHLAEQLEIFNKSLQERVDHATAEIRSAHSRLQLETLQLHLVQARLASSETRLRNILDSAMDAIITIDQSQHIILFNSMAAQMFICPQDQAIGSLLDRFIPQRFRQAHAGHVQQFGDSGVPLRRMGAQRLVMALRSDGQEFPIEASISRSDEDEGPIFTVIVRDVTESLRDQEELWRAAQKLHELALLASHNGEQERRRVARELHDDIAQDLAVLNADIEHAMEQAQTDGPLRVKFEQMQRLVSGAITSTRRIAADLRPSVLDDLGLVAAVEWLADNFTQRTGVSCNVTVDPPEPEIGEPHATAVFRILQESFSNAAKHAHASRVEVTLRVHDGFIDLDVRDDGKGFRPGDPQRAGSMGMVGLRERAQLLGGQTSVNSSPGNGTHVHTTIPCHASVFSLRPKARA